MVQPAEDPSPVPDLGPPPAWGGRGEHLALDPIDGRLYWARARWRRGCPELVAWGMLQPTPGDEDCSALLRRISALPWVRHARIEIALRSPALRHARVNLPALGPREARVVARRKIEEFAAELPPDETTIGWERRAGRTASPLWLVSAPSATSVLLTERWRRLGLPVSRLQCESLALGHLGTLLPRLPEGAVWAICDVREEDVDCVVCDEHGWLFKRLIALQRPGGDAEGESVRTQLRERIVTELRRTVQYVQQELRLGQVGQIALCGTRPDLLALRQDLDAVFPFPVELIGSALTAGPGRAIAPGAARALGLAMSPSPAGGNLLPAQEVRTRRERRSSRLSRATRSAAAALALLSFAAAAQQSWVLSGRVRALQAELESRSRLLREAQQSAEIRARAAHLQRALESLRPSRAPLASWLEILRRVLPDDAALTTLGAKHSSAGWRGTLLVDARAESVSEGASRVAGLAETLSGVELFQVTELERSVEGPPLPNGPLARIRFRMAGPLATLPAERP